MEAIQELIKLLSVNRFSCSKEKETQQEIAEVFNKSSIFYQREHWLDKKSVPDFFIDGIVIEVKIKGNARQIFRQCERYCNIHKVKALILVTNRSMGFPKEINGIPCYFINIGKAWL